MWPRTLLPLLLAACVAPLGPGRFDSAGAPVADRPPRAEVPRVEVEFPPHLARPTREEEERIVSAIGRLWSSEFTVYTKACRELVEIGEPATPYLGYFGDVQKELQPGQRVNVTRIALEPILGTLPGDRLAAALDSKYRAVRIAAAHVAGRRGMTDLTPALLRMLEDSDVADREAAVYALRSLHNRYFGYRASDPRETRDAAAALWRAWWDARARSEEPPAEGAAPAPAEG